MAITLNTTVTVDMKVVVQTEQIAAIEAERARTRVMMADPEAKQMNPRQRLLVDVLTSDRTTEECLEVMFRSGIREWFRESAPREFSEDGIKVTAAPAKVAFKERKVGL